MCPCQVLDAHISKTAYELICADCGQIQIPDDETKQIIKALQELNN